MEASALLSGRSEDKERVLQYLDEQVLQPAVDIMNRNVLGRRVACYPDEPMPTNQRNLTDVRTRMGNLLEYELAQALAEALGPARADLEVTYVVAHRYPDLAFRRADGSLGVRLEVKAIQTLAEEKSANFDALLKDIRDGQDFVAVLLWDWCEGTAPERRFPQIDHAFLLDAYDLAMMRDCYWLNRPPKELGEGRQGFDLRFAVNCRPGGYNQEEGNYGKLMRIFARPFVRYLPKRVRGGTTISRYFELCETTLRLGLDRVAAGIAQAFLGAAGGDLEAVEVGTLCGVHARSAGGQLLIVGDGEMPTRAVGGRAMAQWGADRAMLLNGKFQWRVRDRGWRLVDSGAKPAGAQRWARAEGAR